jgi:hypothetical protein
MLTRSDQPSEWRRQGSCTVEPIDAVLRQMRQGTVTGDGDAPFLADVARALA